MARCASLCPGSGAPPLRGPPGQRSMAADTPRPLGLSPSPMVSCATWTGLASCRVKGTVPHKTAPGDALAPARQHSRAGLTASAPRPQPGSYLGSGRAGRCPHCATWSPCAPASGPRSACGPPPPAPAGSTAGRGGVGERERVRPGPQVASSRVPRLPATGTISFSDNTRSI